MHAHRNCSCGWSLDLGNCDQVHLYDCNVCVTSVYKYHMQFHSLAILWIDQKMKITVYSTRCDCLCTDLLSLYSQYVQHHGRWQSPLEPQKLEERVWLFLLWGHGTGVCRRWGQWDTTGCFSLISTCTCLEKGSSPSKNMSFCFWTFISPSLTSLLCSLSSDGQDSGWNFFLSASLCGVGGCLPLSFYLFNSSLPRFPHWSFHFTSPFHPIIRCQIRESSSPNPLNIFLRM